MATKNVTFMYSAFGPEQFPTPTLPEIAFAGRSNVGKSSLLNALLGQRQLAKVSSTPGRTRSINFFLVEKRFIFSDLPGYGFAKVPTDVKVSWQALIDTYLLGRRSLAGVMLLVDGRHPPHDSDLMLAEWLHANDLPFLVVATKFDKVNSSKRLSHIAALAQGFGVEPDDVLPISSVHGDGLPELWKQIRQAVDGTEAWLKARELWGVPSLKGPKAAPQRQVAVVESKKGRRVEPEPEPNPAPPNKAKPRLTPLHPDFYKQKYKTPKKKGSRRRK